MNSVLLYYFEVAMPYLIYCSPIALIVFCAFTGLKWIIHKKVELNFWMIIDFLWILFTLIILRITGILGMNFQIDDFINGQIHYSLAFFEEGMSTLMILNCILFIPFGFLTPMALKNVKWNIIKGFLLGLLTSSLIEFLQLFAGRYFQLDDILMNTLGTLIGYLMFRFLFTIFRQLKTFAQKMKNSDAFKANINSTKKHVKSP